MASSRGNAEPHPAHRPQAGRWRLPAAFAAVALLGAAAGAWFGYRAADGAERAHAAAVDAAAAPSPASPGMATGPHPMGNGIPARHTPAAASTQDVQRLLNDYAAAMDEDVRGALLARLGEIADADVLHAGLDLASSSDPDTRRRGFELLALFPFHTPGIPEFVVGGLDEEGDPKTLTRLIELASPTVMPTEDAAPLVSRLERLSTHPDPEVRGQSVMQYAQWSGPVEGEALLSRAILDEDPAVRRAAIAGTVATNARSDRLKDALLWIAGDSRASSEDRSAAVFALQSFALDRREYALYRQAATETDDHRPHE